MARTKGLVEAEVFYIPRNIIHPDPEQPRVKIDSDLQASIDADGIIQAITVRPHPELADEWVIVDGERRWLGAAHLKTLPCRIRLDKEDPLDRLITQLAANSGKPLTPIEQARAYRKALDLDPKLTQVKLAERLGVPRATIGDRIRLIEIHDAWTKLIESGRLQVSHAPLIHQYRAVPDEYQLKAAKKVADGEGWQIQKYTKGDVIPISAFRDILRDAFKDYVVRLDEVRSYKGPVLEIEEQTWHGAPVKKVKYAADISIWRPIKREAEKRAKKERESSPSPSFERYVSPMTQALKTLKAAGIDVPTRKSSGQLGDKLKAGETEVIGSNGWASGLHPQTLLDALDPSTLLRVQGSYGEGVLATTDGTAVEDARKVYHEKAAEVSKKSLAPFREKLSDDVLDSYRVSGAGAKALVRYLNQGRGEAQIIALTLGVRLDADGGEQQDTEKVLAAIAACHDLELRLPNSWTIEDKIRQAMGNPSFKLAKAAASTSTEPKSKKQQKREARAAGKQVGDPKRAKDVVHEDPEGEFVAADFEMEEELVEA